MAETKNQSSDELNKPAPISVAPDQEITDAELDDILQEEDPDFAKSVSEIGQDKDLSISQIEMSDEDQALAEEKEAWAHSGKIGRALYRFLPGLPLASLKFKKLKFSVFSFLRAEWVRAKNFLYFLGTDGKNAVLFEFKDVGHGLKLIITDGLTAFKTLSWKSKLAVLGIIVMIVATSAFIYRSVTHGVIVEKTELFMPTLERIATDVKDYDPKTEVEPFYENLRASSNILLIPKMVVNLKRTSQSGSNPMGAFEFFVEGMSPEVVIEVKDREIEIRDLMHRVLEEFTFEQVDSIEGKKLVCEKLKKEVNLLLTTGKLKKVWLKTVIVKP